jgi:hypothetical protein
VSTNSENSAGPVRARCSGGRFTSKLRLRPGRLELTSRHIAPAVVLVLTMSISGCVTVSPPASTPQPDATLPPAATLRSAFESKGMAFSEETFEGRKELTSGKDWARSVRIVGDPPDQVTVSMSMFMSDQIISNRSFPGSDLVDALDQSVVPGVKAWFIENFRITPFESRVWDAKQEMDGLFVHAWLALGFFFIEVDGRSEAVVSTQ